MDDPDFERQRADAASGQALEGADWEADRLRNRSAALPVC